MSNAEGEIQSQEGVSDHSELADVNPDQASSDESIKPGGSEEENLVPTDADREIGAADDEDTKDTKSPDGADQEEDGSAGVESVDHTPVKNALQNESDNIAVMDSVVKEEDMASMQSQNETNSDNSGISDTSAVAELVVKEAISSAVSIVKSEKSIAQTNSEAPENDDKDMASKSDVKVGLFQYDVDDKESSEHDENNTTEGESDNEIVITESLKSVPEKPADSAVGLFQYAVMDETERKDDDDYDDDEYENDEHEKEDEPESNGDAKDEQLDSMNEDEKVNFLKLYGLENIDTEGDDQPVEVETTVGEDNEKEEQTEETVIDVQRQVYEPVSRSFSVTRDPSTTESSPRLDSQDSNGQLIGDIAAQLDSLEFIDQHFAANGDSQSEEQSDEHMKDVGSKEMPVPKASVSPPLVQYESVKENGKFRIIKTATDGGGIRVGSELLSPKPSPKTSPRDSDQDKMTASRDKPAVEVVEDVLGADILPSEDQDLHSSLDRDRIRELLNHESHQPSVTGNIRMYSSNKLH